MALADEVTSRLSAQLVLNLTNPDNPKASTNDTTRLAKAAADAEADFKTFASVEFDVSDDRHVAIGIQGVVAYLKMWGAGGANARTELESFRTALGSLAKVTSRKRITPTTTSTLTPRDVPAEPPAFDEKRFDDIKPLPPPAPEDS